MKLPASSITQNKPCLFIKPMEVLLTAFLLGLLGSFHCLGMCGPIAMALPLQGGWQRKVGTLAYQSGRVLTYALLGLLLGLAGAGAMLIGYQQSLSILLGVLMVAAVLVPAAWWRRIQPQGFISRQLMRLKQALGQQLRRRSVGASLAVGMLNGLLPCGLVYIALAGALATGNPWQGSAFMAAFGLGTWPTMLALSLAGQTISVRWRSRIRAALPGVMLAMGLLLVLRGLNLGIPYLSPAFFEAGGQELPSTICHTAP